MYWQKCMQFSKCSNFRKLKTLYTSGFAIQRDKGRTIISDKQNLENNDGFYASENQN